MKIKKGDKVKIMLGKDNGKEGTVEYVMESKKRVFVGGANIYKRHVVNLFSKHIFSTTYSQRSPHNHGQRAALSHRLSTCRH